MELIRSNRQQAVAARDERHMAIMGAYGDATAMHRRWAYTFADYIADNLQRATDVPALVMMRQTYGNEAIAAVLESHLAAALQAMGVIDKLETHEIRACADALVACERAQTLNFARVLAFCVWLKRGGYELHGITPYQILRAFNAYQPEALAAQIRAEREQEGAMERVRYDQHRRDAITFEEWAVRTGYTGDNPLETVNKL